MADGHAGVTRASQALKRWMLTTGTSQVRLAELVTEKLGRLKPVNQSTISSWARGAYPPGGPGMVALQQITGIALADWIVPAEDSSPDLSANDSGQYEKTDPEMPAAKRAKSAGS